MGCMEDAFKSKKLSRGSYRELCTTSIPTKKLGVRLDTAENCKLKLKTEKYCSKIIFKCVNSTVGPIFNEKVAEK